MRAIIIAAVVAAFCTSARAETKEEICAAVSNAVFQTVSARQDGIALDAVLEMADQSFPPGEALDMVKGMAIRVYATVPVFTDKSVQSGIAEAYRAQVYAECLEKDF